MVGALARFVKLCEGVDLPIVTLEMRRTQRGLRPFGVMFAYVLVLGVVAMAMTYASGAELSRNSPTTCVSGLGGELFGVVSLIQLGMITLIVPALSARSISSEREAGTLEMLGLTLMSSRSIVYQKLAGAVLQIAMLALASLPVMAIAFMLGGVSPLDVLLSYVVLMLIALFYGSIGILCSAACSNSRMAVICAYVLILIVVPMCANPVAFMMVVVVGKQLGFWGGRWETVFFGLIAAAVVVGVSVLLNSFSASKLNSMRRSY